MERWGPTQEMLGVFLRRILVKQLLLIGTTVLMATSAQARVWVPGSYEWYARYNCSRQVYISQIRTGDPRWQRHFARARAYGNSYGLRLYLAHNTEDGRSITRSATRYCAARGQ